jgi:DNA-binding NtrC family response regulator
VCRGEVAVGENRYVNEADVGIEREVGRKILVVDDEQIILDLLRRVLSREGYRVTTARRVEDALREVNAESYDLAITDVDLYRSDGRELMRLIEQASPDTALVVMTGYPEEAVVRFARDHAQGLLAKPFALEQLLAVVRGAMSARAEGAKQVDVSRLRPYLEAGVRA